MGPDTGKIAEMLMREHADGTAFQPFAAARGITTAGDAYAVQREYVRLLRQSRRTAAAGYKIGLTTPRMQAMCGIDSPVAGVVLQERVHASGTRISTSAYGALGLEFEIAVRLGHDLVPSGPAPTLAEVAAAVDGVCPAIELIDDRGADYRKLDAFSLIADNAWNGGIVLGELHAGPGPISPPSRRSWRRTARSSIAALAATCSVIRFIRWRGSRSIWRHRDSRLRAGDIVMTGSVVTTKFPDRSASYHYELAGCGAVELSVSV